MTHNPQKVCMIDGVVGKPCTNAKFMHIAGLPGMNVETSYDCHYNEEVTMVYRNGEVMAMREMECIHFPGEKSKVDCFIFGYYKGIENE